MTAPESRDVESAGGAELSTLTLPREGDRAPERGEESTVEITGPAAAPRRKLWPA